MTTAPARLPFACPVCRTPLVAVGADLCRCPSDASSYPRVDGIWRCLPPDRATFFSVFTEDYQAIRRAEGRGTEDSAYYRALPFRDVTGRFVHDWRIRARSYRSLLARVVRPLEAARGRPLVALDLGAGCGWLAHRLADHGHAVAAVDLLTNDSDGLGGHVHYRGRGFVPVQAEFDRLPFVDGLADLVVFNASFHYATDYSVTLAEALRVLAAGGRVAIVDTPLYRDGASGARMVEERAVDFERRYGRRSDRLPMENYLTHRRLEELAAALDLEVRLIRPYYGLRWAARPLIARVRGWREPATFGVIAVSRGCAPPSLPPRLRGGKDGGAGSPAGLRLLARRLRNARDHRIRALPIVILLPHGGCNCRCVMCDVWRANTQRSQLSEADVAHLLPTLRRLGVRTVVLSGGEPLLHPAIDVVGHRLKGLPARIILLTAGLRLAAHAAKVAPWCDEVVVSLDGSPAVHDAIRQVPGAFARLAAGVGTLRAAAPGLPIAGRAVIQRGNFRDLPRLLDTARELRLDRLSFLAADVYSTAFNRPIPWDAARAAAVALAPDEAAELARIVEDILRGHRRELAGGFAADGPEQLRRIVAYYAALTGGGEFPAVRCNAPWVSAVIEADGAVRPCFFHPPLGRLGNGDLEAVLNSSAAVDFRRRLDVRRDPVCRRCVCSLYLPPTARG